MKAGVHESIRNMLAGHNAARKMLAMHTAFEDMLAKYFELYEEKLKAYVEKHGEPESVIVVQDGLNKQDGIFATQCCEKLTYTFCFDFVPEGKSAKLIELDPRHQCSVCGK